MIGRLDAATWRAILDDADEPTIDGVADVLARKFSRTHAIVHDELEDTVTDPSSPVTRDADGALVVDETPADTDTTDTDTDTETDTDAGDGSDAGDADTSVSLDVAEPSGREFYPNALVERDWWVNWVLAYRYDDDERDDKPTKQPVAPYDRHDAAPVLWNFDLPDDEHPCTSLERVEPWSGMSTTLDVATPERVVSDELGTGIILPRGQGPDTPDDRTILLIDWDDVRDPETKEIHPVVERALAECGGYAEISQSGEGIHQFVYGEIPGAARKFIRHVDDEPFIGDSLPDIEIYQSGRVCAMTGRHVAGSGDDVVDGQDMVDRLCWEFGMADNSGPGTPTDPYADERDTDDGSDAGDAGDVPRHDVVARALDEAAAFDDDDPDEWEYPDEWSLRYAAIVRGRSRSDELAGMSNWELNGYAASVGNHDGHTLDDVVGDLAAVCDDDNLRKEVRQVWRKAEAGDYEPPSRSRLARRGLLPERYDAGDDTGARENQLVALPDVDEHEHADDDAGDDVVDVDDDPPHGALTVAHARRRTLEALTTAYTADDDVLLEALPSMGKSYGSVAAAVATDTPVTILVGRGQNEQYARIREWCREQGLDVGQKHEPNGDVYTLPAFHRDCETANGDHGDDWATTVEDWYQAGATPKQIHKLGPYAVDADVDALPCHRGDAVCGYTRRWDFDPDEFDVLIGHYAHAHKPKVTAERVVVLDEFTSAYETTLAGDELRGAVNRYLEEHGVAARDEFVDDREGGYLAYQSYADLLLARDDDERRAAAVTWLRNRGVDPDEDGAIYLSDTDETPPHAVAPLAIYTILKSATGTLGNGYERVAFRPDVDGDRRIGVFNPHGKDRKDGEPAVSILRPPRALDAADVVVGLDGTPTREMWELMCGRSFDHRVVLEGRRAEYLETALNFRILPTTDAVKPYNNAPHVHVDHDAALLEAIGAHHDADPAVITTATALRRWDDAGVFDAVTWASSDPYERVDGGPAVGVTYHGDVLGSNAFGDERVGAVIGSNHYGDGFVKRWGAYAGEAVERGDGKGADLSYGPFGDKILRHMTEHDTLQALLRFGRDAGGATVYVDTATLPDWVPTHGRGDVRGVSDGLVGVLEALEDVGPASTAELVDHDAVPIGARQVRDHLETLRDLGVVETSSDPADGRRHIHHAADTTPVTATGVVDLPDDVARPTRSRPSSQSYGGDDDGRSSGTVAYDRSIYVRVPEDHDAPSDVADGRIREVAIPDGGVVAFNLTWGSEPPDDEPLEKVSDDELADTDRVELGSLTVSGLDVHAKTSDDAGDPWYVTRDGETDDVGAHRRGSTPSTRRRSRPAQLDGRGRRRGEVARLGPTHVDTLRDDPADDVDADAGDAD